MSQQPWQDTSLSFEERARDLVSRMDLDEKLSQIRFRASALPRFGIPEYSWWSEALHGVARAGNATVFPQAIGLGAAFNQKLIRKIADVISDEARAKHHECVRREDRYDYKGLNFWSPNINIFRDPRWGRGHETFGEDPYLTARTGVAFCKGLQGDDPKYLKTVATPKHYAAHSGPESTRRGFNAEVSQKDLRETYLPAFKACVQEAGAYSVMGAYNAVNGEACCASPTLIGKMLREEWGFDGFVVSDCWAVMDFHEHHHITKDAPESAALAVNNGLDLNCGVAYDEMHEAINRGLVSEGAIETACYRVMLARFKLGMFDSAEECAYQNIPFEIADSETNHELCLQAGRESIVLLKNDGVLPLDPGATPKIAVIGPNAHSKDVLLGNYAGAPSIHFTLLDGMRALCPDATITYAEGCALKGQGREGFFQDVPYWGFSEAMAVAERADVVVLAMGLDHTMEGEEGDKDSITLPEVQMQLFQELAGLNKPMVVVNLSGSAVDLREISERANALIQGWYPGQFGGLALAETLLGLSNPSGRLPITFYKDMSQVPDFSDYSMQGRTYRFFGGEPLYPFGYGLSYTRFEYSGLSLSAKTIPAGQELTVSVTLANTGNMPGWEAAQVYLTDLEASARVPFYALAGFEKVYLEPGQKQTLSFTLIPRQMAVVQEDGSCAVEPGEFVVSAGGQQPDALSARLTGKQNLEERFAIVGEALAVEP